MKYTEEDLREAFRAGEMRGAFNQAGNYFDAPLDEGEYIESLSTVVKNEEEEILFSYGFLRRKLDWEDFCDLTGIDYYAKRNGFLIEYNDTFKILKSKAKEYNLI